MLPWYIRFVCSIFLLFVNANNQIIGDSNIITTAFLTGYSQPFKIHLAGA